MTDIEIVGRGTPEDLERLFSMSGCLSYPKLSHYPFIAFTQTEDGTVVVNIVTSAQKLVTDFPLDTPVMIQWAGRWSSDFFKMKVSDVKAALNTRNSP